ncbi:uncharacterized protein BKCO1_11000158 [Diplodia corticola]|uniref:Uncharacterized protein n=1 Tax=Diplodia corticola TaxID=236234 RepID=A0A1J9S7P4_9PEZI|nr:uncharacterized protein BKCO1_11000158 [Diplodia corticola]OJD36511.1 hypothetical protein BKCO1_11000158 [Diplodia corticola]
MLRPSVLHPVSLLAFLRHLIDHHAPPTSLVVCSSRADFEQLLHRLAEDARTSERVASAGTQDSQEHSPSPPPPLLDELLMPTIHNLFTTSTIHVTFCASLEALRAYLSSLTTRASGDPASQPTQASTSFGGPTSSYPILALLNPIALHRETTSFSAQGLSRTLAVAVEAAAFRKQKLVITECPIPHHLHRRRNEPWTEEEEALLGAEFGVEEGAEGDTEQRDREGGTATDDSLMPGTAIDRDPWAEKLSILNVTTKSFGIGDRAWAGRTVTARSVAERWCHFEMLH